MTKDELLNKIQSTIPIGFNYSSTENTPAAASSPDGACVIRGKH